MGEWIRTKVTFSGRITRPDAELLVELLQPYCFYVTLPQGTDNELTPELLTKGTLEADEVNYGQIDDVIAFCVAKNVGYEHWVEDLDGSPAYTQRWTPGMAESVQIDDVEGEPSIPISRILELEALVTGWADLLKEARYWTTPLPPLEII